MAQILKKITLITVMILAFVSFLDVAKAKTSSKTSTKGQADEFSAFDDEEASAKPAKKKKKKKSKDDDLEDFSALEEPEEKSAGKNTTASLNGTDSIADLAQQMVSEKKTEEAVQLLWRNIEKASPKGFAILGKIYEERGDWSELAKVANLMIGKNDKDYRAYTFLANSYRIRPKTAPVKTEKDAAPVDPNEVKAVEYFTKALEINKKYEPAHQGLVKLYDTHPKMDYYEMVRLQSQNTKKAIPKSNYFELRSVYQDMIGALGKRADLLAKLCEVNTMDEALELGITSCKDAIAASSKIPEPHVYLGICYQETGSPEKAVDSWKYASKNFPSSEMAQFYYGKALEENKNFIDSMKVYAVGTAADKKSYRCWFGLANSAFELRKYDVALDAYRMACSLNRSPTSALRKAAQSLRSAKSGDFASKFDALAETCGL